MLDKCAFWQDFFVFAADLTPEGALRVSECRVLRMQTPGGGVWCLEVGICPIRHRERVFGVWRPGFA